MRKLLRNPWFVPAVAGLLIISAAIAGLADLPQVRMGLMVAAALVAGTPIAWRAVQALRYKAMSIDLLVTIAFVGALILGEAWEAAAVTTLFAIGNALEAATMDKTRSALSALIEAAPQTALVVDGDQTVEVPAGSVTQGQPVLLQVGSVVPVDGVVTAGRGALDEASITGESMPVEKTVGSQVYAGTLTSSGLLWVEATGVGADTTLAKIVHRVEEAQDAKAKVASFMDRFARWYTPAIMATSLVVGLVTGNVTLALTFLVIACPGALVISIPVAIVAGIGRAARDGVLIKGGEHLETAARINAVALDKTGTLTEGKPSVQTVLVAEDQTTEGAAQHMVLLAAVAERSSSHPLAQAILDYADTQNLGQIPDPDSIEVIAGRGIEAHWQGERILAGTAPFLVDEGVTSTKEIERISGRFADLAQTPVLVAEDGHLLGGLGISDTVRPDARQLVTGLHAVGVRKVAMLTGDQQPVADAIAKQTGIDTVYAALMPEGKREAILEMQNSGLTVAMAGDGINDAPAMVTANVGVAMGLAGTDVAIETADIALMSDNLSRLPHAIRVAKRTVRTMHQNIFIALATVAALIAGVLAGGVTMSLGMLIHEGSVLVVILNGMRLMRLRPRTPEGPPAAQAESVREPEAVTIADGTRLT